MKSSILLSFILLTFITHLSAQNAVELRFQGERVEDIAGKRQLELIDVVVFSNGGKTYGDFNGKSAIVIPGDPELSFSKQNSLWIEMWINPSKIGAGVALASKGSGANYRIGLQKGGEVFLSYYSAGTWRSLVSETPLEMNQWQHVALWFDSPAGKAALFLNGKVIALSSEMQPFQSRDEQPLYVGGAPKQDGGYSGLTGGIGAFILSGENPRNIPDDLELDQQVFEVTF